ncbi:amino acid amidase [Fusarium heterosporum]|uniref:Amino acid amidase n=1 Tax=Fusarium heterosporum TaxID=42747 RepID=A0A8H5T365_FUSHE|nr:amino acid amidase [Fusarium heterosporum]
MSAIAGRTGTVDFAHEALDQQVQTFYRVIGDLESGQRPLIAAHGGPGSSHDYFLDPLASYPEETGRPLVLYDQVGNAKSTNFTFESKSLPNLSVDVYTAELNNLVTKLGIQEFDYLGHSWGGMMGLEYVIKYQPKIKHLILDSVPASVDLWTNKIKNTLNELEPADRDLALELDAAQQYEDPRLQAILKKLQDKHVCRLDPWPEAAQGFFGTIMGNPAVYATMLGPSQFDTLGALKGWSVVGRCQDIKVPTLVLHGEYDWADDAGVKPLVEEIENSRQVTLKGCSHMCHLEDTEAFKKEVFGFLNN